MAKKLKLVKGVKKEWVEVIAPEVLGSKSLGEIITFDPKTLVGRVLKLSYSVITANPHDSDKKFAVRIIDVKNGKALTQPESLLFTEGYVQRATKRYSTNLPAVSKHKSKDEKAIIVKLYILARKALARSIGSKMIATCKQSLDRELGNIGAAAIFEPTYIDTLSKILKKDLKIIYPVDRVIFWKVLVK